MAEDQHGGQIPWRRRSLKVTAIRGYRYLHRFSSAFVIVSRSGELAFLLLLSASATSCAVCGDHVISLMGMGPSTSFGGRRCSSA